MQVCVCMCVYACVCTYTWTSNTSRIVSSTNVHIPGSWSPSRDTHKHLCQSPLLTSPASPCDLDCQETEEYEMENSTIAASMVQRMAPTTPEMSMMWM